MGFILSMAVSVAVMGQTAEVSVTEQESGGAAESDGAASAAETDVKPEENTLFLEEETPQDEEYFNPPSTLQAALRMILILALSAAAIYGLVFFIKKIGRPTQNKDPYLKVLASTHLGSNQYIHVVSLGEKAWLIGASDGAVSLLGEVEDKEIVDALLLEESLRVAEVKALDFKAIIRKLGSRTRVPESKDLKTSAEKLKERRERLRSL